MYPFSLFSPVELSLISLVYCFTFSVLIYPSGVRFVAFFFLCVCVLFSSFISGISYVDFCDEKAELARGFPSLFPILS